MANIWKDILYNNLDDKTLKVFEEENAKLVKNETKLTSLFDVEKNKNIFKVMDDGEKFLLVIESGYSNSQDVFYKNAEPKVDNKEFERIGLMFNDLEYIKKLRNLLNDMVELAEKNDFYKE